MAGSGGVAAECGCALTTNGTSLVYEPCEPARFAWAVGRKYSLYWRHVEHVLDELVEIERELRGR